MKYFYGLLGIFLLFLVGIMLTLPSFIVGYVANNGISSSWLTVSKKELVDQPYEVERRVVKEQGSILINNFLLPQYFREKFFLFPGQDCFLSSQICSYQYITRKRTEAVAIIKGFESSDLSVFYPQDPIFQLPLFKNFLQKKLIEKKLFKDILKPVIKDLGDKFVLNLEELSEFVYKIFCLKVRSKMLNGDRVVRSFFANDLGYFITESIDKHYNVKVIHSEKVDTVQVFFEDGYKSHTLDFVERIFFKEGVDKIEYETRYLELSAIQKKSPAFMSMALVAYDGDRGELRSQFIRNLSYDFESNKKILRDMFQVNDIKPFKEMIQSKEMKIEEKAEEKDEPLFKKIDDDRVFAH